MGEEFHPILPFAGIQVGKPESLTTLRRNELRRLTFRILMGLPGQSELARSGQRVRFFHLEKGEIAKK